MAKRAITDTLTLSSSAKIPRLGFGVYRSPTNVCVQSCLTALECGYRHIDTAQFYGNEAEVGQAVKQSGLPRKDVFLTTKILTPGGSVDQSYQKCVDSVRKLDPRDDGYVDLFLIHTSRPTSDQRKEMWLALERLHAEGKAKSIGVSNFGIGQIEELKPIAKVWPPHVNQIELHPWSQQKEIVAYCERSGIAVEAYCPLVRNTKAQDETLGAVARKHSVAPSQVLIRYCLQRNWIPLPKSDNPDRIRANADVFGFELADDDMARLDGLDQGPAGSIVMVVKNP
ncbi:NADP-dependent oxidoreductase domain-containing protein [Hypoxylon sp. FL1284]|nr:NADP-dependent oxidoreductase domain-containing protein [Hypoxylon sp. FL1284]